MTPHFLYYILINLLVVFSGYYFIKSKMIWPCWILLVINFFLSNWILSDDSPPIRFVLLAYAIFISMKAVTNAASYKNKEFKFSMLQWLVISTTWAGMRAEPFETLGQKPVPNAWTLVRFGAIRVVIGIGFIILAHWLVSLEITKSLRDFMVTLAVFLGFYFTFTFGLLTINAGLWRLFGAKTYLLFNEPIKSLSLTEFWSKRWNIIFSEMIAITIIKPLKKKIGYNTSILIGFIFSGLLHELIFSVPVYTGYGFPLLYLILQGVLVITERVLIKNKIMILTNKRIGALWTLFWLVAPISLLFRDISIKEILWKLFGLG